MTMTTTQKFPSLDNLLVEVLHPDHLLGTAPVGAPSKLAEGKVNNALLILPQLANLQI